MSGNLILIRGISGSGKTTMAEELLKVIDAKHFEADMFFTDVFGEYIFDGSKLKDAHKWCRTVTKQALDNGYNVIVANTFTQKWEMKDYRDMDYNTIAIFECFGNFKSVHDVPKEKIQQMKDRWEKLYP